MIKNLNILADSFQISMNMYDFHINIKCIELVKIILKIIKYSKPIFRSSTVLIKSLDTWCYLTFK